MTAIDLQRFARFNMWKDAAGEDIVRPGLRRVYEATREVLAAFTVRNEYVDEAVTFIVERNPDDYSEGISVRILDEGFGTFQVFRWAPDGSVPPVVVTHAVVEGQILICAPGLPTLFGLVGGSIDFAVKVDSDNPGTTAIDVPRGIVASFCNRFVIADGRSLFFSDPIAADGGDGRTFVGANQNQRPGVVYGLHEGAGGMLVVVTSAGVYGLDADAAAVQIVGSNGTAWRLLSHLTSAAFSSSCVHRGRVYVLTEAGYAPGDVETLEEVFLSDPVVPRTIGVRVTSSDFRRCRMLATDTGPLVVGSGERFHRSDLAEKCFTWWSGDDFGDVVGTARDHDGTEMLATADGLHFVVGDFDGDVPLEYAEDLEQPIGVLSGVVPFKAGDNVMPRHLRIAAAVDGAHRLIASVRGSQHEATVPAEPFGLIVGTSSWGAAGRRYMPTPIMDAEIDFGDVKDSAATRDVGIEIAAEGAGARVHMVPELIISGSATRRPSAKG